ncbi:MAG: PHP domain-containing protein [Ignavibacteria bacterium]
MENLGIIKADLHTHTYYSDGKFSPSELIRKAKDKSISLLSITDHDNIDAIDEAYEYGKELGVEVIPGVEISSVHNEREIHILGYFIDTKNKELQNQLSLFRNQRLNRAVKIVEKLNELGIPIKLENVIDKVIGNGSIGRPHIAFALQEGQFIESYFEAFTKYIGNGKPAYVKKLNPSVKETADIIAKAGGLSFIAHPGKNIRDVFLTELIDAGIDGIEVIHPSHSAEDINYFQGIVSQYFLLESGGSDFHGGRINDESILGTYFISEQKVDAMKKRLFQLKKY